MPSGDLSTLDFVCRVVDSRLRPLDYALLLHFHQPPDGNGLQRGAISARNLYPSTGSRVDGKTWRRLKDPGHGLAVKQAAAGNTVGTVQDFLRVPFRLDREPPVRQLLVQGEEGPACLVTRIHHVGGDLLSALMWVRHQLRVAKGRDPFVEPGSPFEPLRLRHSTLGASKNASAWRGRCHPIWTRQARRSPERHWKTLRIEAASLRGLSRSREGFTYNDVLVCCVLDTLHWWNTEHGADRRKIGLWLPMNIREEALAGFGNGTSRIRVYRRFSNNDSIHSKCRQLRHQVNGSRRNGEWAVPDRHLLTRLPFPAARPLLRGYLKRPWADTGSAAFTHVEQWPGQDDEEFASIQGMEVIGALHARHALMLAALTHAGQTWTTLTYDPAMLNADEVSSIGQRLEHAVSTATRGL